MFVFVFILEGVLKKFASKTKRRIFLEPRKPLSFTAILVNSHKNNPIVKYVIVKLNDKLVEVR